MTLTKVTGGLCGTLLVLLLGKWAAELIYDTSGGHGGDHAEQAYLIETGDDDHGGGEEEGPSFAELYASADADKGKKVFGKCKACHKLEDGANSTGPYLYGVVGRAVGAASGFSSYSGALNQVGDSWTPEALDAFIANPKKDAPGTTMAFAGLKKEEDRANLIAYLDLTDGSMTELAAPAAAEAEAPGDDAEASAEEGEMAEEEASTEVATDDTDEAASTEDTSSTSDAADEAQDTDAANTEVEANAEEDASAEGEANADDTADAEGDANAEGDEEEAQQ
ncbi:c-type cytochrome [Roseovarius albus]|nr:c-type cytochrome [Roseovarius albus]